MKKFRCIPVAIGLPIIFMLMAIPYLVWMLISLVEQDYDVIDLCVFFILLTVGTAIATLLPAIRRVEIGADKIICKGLLPRDTICIEYSKCNIGMDYHIQNYNEVWWIYFCYGMFPKYRSKNPANRINALKFKPGFIKIMYSDEVYEALMEVLPKKQRTALETARRCAGFEKQGKIIF